MNKKEIESFEKVFTQLLSFHQETAILVKKDPDGVMNKFKFNLINKVLAKANEIVDDTRPFEDFEGFDLEGDLPFNSDVAMILGQYLNCMELIRKDNVHMWNGRWYWNVDGDVNKDTIRTTDPIYQKK